MSVFETLCVSCYRIWFTSVSEYWRYEIWSEETLLRNLLLSGSSFWKPGSLFSELNVPSAWLNFLFSELLRTARYVEILQFQILSTNDEDSYLKQVDVIQNPSNSWKLTVNIETETNVLNLSTFKRLRGRKQRKMFTTFETPRVPNSFTSISRTYFQFSLESPHSNV